MVASKSPRPAGDHPRDRSEARLLESAWERGADEASEVVTFGDAKARKAVRIVWTLVDDEWRVRVIRRRASRRAGPKQPRDKPSEGESDLSSE